MELEPPVCDIALNQSELTTVQLKQIQLIAFLARRGSKNIVFKLVFCVRSYWTGLARARAETIHKQQRWILVMLVHADYGRPLLLGPSIPSVSSRKESNG